MAQKRHVRVVRPFGPVIGATFTPSRDAALRERFQAKACPGLDPGWKPVRVKKTRQIKKLEPRFDSIETEEALAAPRRGWSPRCGVLVRARSALSSARALPAVRYRASLS